MEEPKLYVEETVLYDVGTYKPDDLTDMFVQLIPVAWNELLYNHTGELQDVGTVLKRLVKDRGHKLTPHPWNVFRALALTPPAMVKVVIIGQDPYFLMDGDQPAATGLCFENARGRKIQRSLTHIINVLAVTIGDDVYRIPRHGELTHWAEQGVLLLNAALTTNVGEANKHAAIWQFFPKRVLEYLSKTRKHVVYMLWGKFAQQFENIIDKTDNLILTASHPAARGNHNTFFKCNHFLQANEYLSSHGVQPIDWQT